MIKLIISICIVVISNLAVAKETLFDLPKIEENAEIEAEELFKEGKYKESLEIYLSLAKIGDKYSQYMVSLQFFNGLGIKKDKLKAYGWANLARRVKSKEIRDYYHQVKSTIAKDELVKAETIKAELSEKYSDLVIAMRLKRMIRNTIPKCGGSRIRGNCSFVKHYCFNNGSQKSYDKCLREVALRDPKVIRKLKHDLAKTDEYIELKLQAGGSVTVKELESPEKDKGETKEK